jgi:hypothetical protein
MTGGDWRIGRHMGDDKAQRVVACESSGIKCPERVVNLQGICVGGGVISSASPSIMAATTHVTGRNEPEPVTGMYHRLHAAGTSSTRPGHRVPSPGVFCDFTQSLHGNKCINV